MTVACPIHDLALRAPNLPALRWEEATLSYLELDRQIDGLIQALEMEGIQAGHRVGLLLPNNWPYAAVLWALFRLKAVAVPLHVRAPAAKIREQLLSIDVRICIVADSFDATWPENEIRIVRIDSLIEKGPSGATSVKAAFDTEQPATILFTSGSTGQPKAALHAWGNHYFNALGSNENIVLHPGDAWLLSLPLYHVAGISILFRCFLAGACVALPSAGQSIEKALADPGLTHVSLVATQLKRLLDAYETPLSHLKALLIGGSALPASLVERAWKAGWPIHTTYGMTEMASQVTTTPPGATLPDLLTSGRLLRHRTLRVADDGEICVGGPARFLGYVTGAGVTPACDDAGWYHTGDLGYVDADGWLHVQGRKDHMFISGGENIYPEEIERVLEANEAIDRAIVVPVSDAEYGRRPVAFVSWKGAAQAPETLGMFLENRLPRYMIPVAWFPLEERDGEMKISRSMLTKSAERKRQG